MAGIMWVRLILITCWIGLYAALEAQPTLSEKEATDIANMLMSHPTASGLDHTLSMCKIDAKDFHATVQATAHRVLQGVCNPAELEAHLEAMEERLNQKLEQMKQTFTSLLTGGVTYDYGDESAPGGRQESQADGAAGGTGEAELTHYSQFSGADRRAAATGQRTTTHKRYGPAVQDTGSSGADRRYSGAAGRQRGQGDQGATWRGPGGTYRYDQYGGTAGSQASDASSYQYSVAADSDRGSASGTRQVSSNSLDSGRGGGRAGDTVRYGTSYTPVQPSDQYTAYDDQKFHKNGGRWQHRRRHRHQGRRHRTARRREQSVTDTVTSLAGTSSSAIVPRYPEIQTFNDTVYRLDGKLMYSYYWEVKDFPTMMATWEDRDSLRSASFYIFDKGYRMYLRVFPSRQGGNVYLHAGLTPGRYDDTLPWPFRLRLRVSLLDHSATPLDIQSRIWNPRELCSGWNWRRPKNKDNFECVGLGFPQQLLSTRRFIVDDAIIIKLDVFLNE